MARSYEQIMKDIETVKATPAFQKKMAAWQKELDKQKKTEKAETAKSKTKPKSPTTRATSRTPKIRGGSGMRGGIGSLGTGGGLRGSVNKQEITMAQMKKPVVKATTKPKAPAKKKVLVMPNKISPSKMTPAQKARYLKNPERYDG